VAIITGWFAGIRHAAADESTSSSSIPGESDSPLLYTHNNDNNNNNKHDGKTRCYYHYYYYYYYIVLEANIPTATIRTSPSKIPLPRDERVSRRPGCCTDGLYRIILLYVFSVVKVVVAGIPVPTGSNHRRRWWPRPRRPVMRFFRRLTRTSHTTRLPSSSSQSFNTTFSRSFAVVASVAPLVATAKFTRHRCTYVYIIYKRV